MSGLIRNLTFLVLPIPLLMTVFAVALQFWPLLLVAAFIATIYAIVWLWWRPYGFEIRGGELRLLFPMRALSTSLSQIAVVRRLSDVEFKQEFGRGARIGAGGLWGGFGWLWTQKKGILEMYISKQDDYVLIERRSRRALLLTPNRVEAFIAALQGEQGQDQAD